VYRLFGVLSLLARRISCRPLGVPRRTASCQPPEIALNDPGRTVLSYLVAEAARRAQRWLGIDPGRALTNAKPDSRQRRVDRVEQFAFIAGSRAGAGEQLALVTRRGSNPADGEVSVLVFENDRLVAHPTSLDRSLRESIPQVAGN
jgi:hypothetical protein